jgi:radical SAM protein with 4Fe4S-binding SPASM domain
MSLSNLHLTSLQIELTTRCNERCVHCYIPHKNKVSDIDPELLYNVLDQCRAMGVEQITFSGGEPMLHPGFLEALSKADRKGFKLRIFSNLMLLTDNTLAALKALHIHEVQASLYSADPAIHDAITQLPGSCEDTKAGIETLVNNNIPVFVSCPVMKQNRKSYAGVIRWTKALGIRSAPDTQITARSDHSSDNLENRLNIEEALQVIEDILESDPGAYGRDRFAPGYHNPEAALPCVQGVSKDSLAVNAAGDVLPSPAWNCVLGNLHRQTLRDIWEHSTEIEGLRAIGLKDFPKCQNCPDLYFCGMSLEGNANENPGGDPFIIPAQTCELARRTRELVHGWHRKNNTGKKEQKNAL